MDLIVTNQDPKDQKDHLVLKEILALQVPKKDHQGHQDPQVIREMLDP